ncbi:MAG: Rod shape-determining protein RodA [Candidatus Roizmanbacteria bacterium GW2011_GWA2_37_7]|uniref:Rod shape-determining protein RodA n=1 Tax=Candidatus Roizmanbacteria bacterium GW2011_GWA2_37_7 TaxID=1618481 RepID=A0A0G0HCZ8_9BACT|nr:MAG: Rod shape-determining protein RodA [Candidatus Roizmanbacteria bacterium GW2011_GWA2_37_7]
MFFGIGSVFFIVIRYLQVQRHFFRQNATVFYWIFIILLVFTHFSATEIKGSKRWIDLYFFQLQTSEIFKIFFIVYLARIFSTVKMPIESSKLFLKTLIFTIIPFVLIFQQPDFGSAIIILAVFFVTVLHSTVPKKQILGFVATIVILLPVLWFSMKEYQKNRIVSFINPIEYLSGASYNMVQAKIAIGSGSFLGKGLGMGKQSLLNFLPEYHTDFAYSSLVEQFGFVGGALVIILYGLFFYLLFYRMSKYIYTHDIDKRYRFFYLLGFSTVFIVQTGVNIGMNLGLLPVAGITLPFISYGGSSLITIMIGLALIP